MRRGARRCIGSAYSYRMVVHMIAMHMVHMPVMEIAIMIVMLDSLVTTAFSVLMFVLAVNFTRHLNSPYSDLNSKRETDKLPTRKTRVIVLFCSALLK